MNYSKPPLPIADQVQKLVDRGLVGDRDVLAEHLAVVSYTRLEAYWLPFQNPDKTFKPGTTFETVWQRYVFDRHLRLLVLDAIERIEVAVRTQLALHHSLAHGAFAYAEQPGTLPKLSPEQHAKFQEALTEQLDRCDEMAVAQFLTDHGAHHAFLPVWLAIEIMSFGSVLTFFRGAEKPIQLEVSNLFGVHHTVFESWLLTLNVIRNFCAHHSRLWNRVLGVKPKIPQIKNDDRWYTPVRVSNDRAFGVLTVCKFCMDRVAPQSDWPMRVRGLIESEPAIPIRDMGFPANWIDCPIWNAAASTETGGTDG